VLSSFGVAIALAWFSLLPVPSLLSVPVQFSGFGVGSIFRPGCAAVARLAAALVLALSVRVRCVPSPWSPPSAGSCVGPVSVQFFRLLCSRLLSVSGCPPRWPRLRPPSPLLRSLRLSCCCPARCCCVGLRRYASLPVALLLLLPLVVLAAARVRACPRCLLLALVALLAARAACALARCFVFAFAALPARCLVPCRSFCAARLPCPPASLLAPSRLLRPPRPSARCRASPRSPPVSPSPLLLPCPCCARARARARLSPFSFLRF
jgi:hypothetical protein